MSDEWEMIVRVRLRNAMDHGQPCAEECLRETIKDEGGVLPVISGWCDADDLEIVSLRPVP